MILSTAMLCLALNIYHEGRGEPLIGQHAIAQVTYNRANRNPDNVCKEVFKPKQFSWANTLTETKGAERARRSKKFIPTDDRAWDIARSIAFHTVKGNLADFTKGATFFHTKSVRPIWRHSFERVYIAGAGRHLFYRNIA